MRIRPGVAALLGLLLLNSACATPVVVQRLGCDTPTATSALVGARLTLNLEVSRPANGADGSGSVGNGSAGSGGASGGGSAGSDTAAGRLNPEVPAAGTHVYMADAGGHPLPGLPTGTTDAKGRAQLPDVPADTPYEVIAPVKTGAGAVIVLKTLAKPHGDNLPPVPINMATTLVTEAVIWGLRGQVTDVDVAAFERAVAQLTIWLGTHRAPDLTDQVAVIAWLNEASAQDATLREAIAILRAAAQRPQPSPRPSPSPSGSGGGDASPSPTAPAVSASPIVNLGGNGNGVQVSSLASTFTSPYALGINARGDLYVAWQGGVSRVTGTGTKVTVLAPMPCYGVAVDAAGTVYASEAGNRVIDRIKDGLRLTFADANSAGTAGGVGTPGNFRPWGMVTDAAGNLIFADNGNHCIRKITPGGVVFNHAGTGEAGHQDGPAAQAQFDAPMNLAIDAEDNLYVTDHGSGYIRKITPLAQVSTLGQVTGATGIAVDSAGTVYVSSDTNVIVRLEADGSHTVLAGTEADTGGLLDTSGTDARFKNPLGLAVGPDGVLYVADTWNNRIRRIQ